MIVEAQVTIKGSKAATWAAITNIANAPDIISGIEKIEIVEKPTNGLVGLKWKETRILFGKPATVEKWITEAKENAFYTTRAEDSGFVFVTTQRLSGNDGSIMLTSSHETLPQGFAAKLKSLPMVFFKGVIKKAVLQDLNDIKKAVEDPMMEYGPPEKVYVENDWYDGPLAGVADINGIPHRFKLIFDEAEDEYRDMCMVWPIDNGMLALEVEQWEIFVAWNRLYESGQADTDSHPGRGGLNARWGEIDALLKHDRTEVPVGSKWAVFQFIRIDRNDRYAPTGPDYMLSWNTL